MGYELRWALWMTAFGIIVALAVYVVTQSVGWAIVGLLAAGIVVNILVHPGLRGPTGPGRF